ncbi:MAG: hypothetical protein IJO33_00835 [Bacilli bacterium]|nr:hypothetical protein [Bacilli bacterium]
MKKKIVIVEKNNINKFYKKINWLKLQRLIGYKIYISYNNEEYSGEEKKYPEEIEVLINILKILNASTKYERLNIVYDISCDYLDNEFRNKNLCGFKNDMCECNRNKPKDKQVYSCCTGTTTRILCDKFDKKLKTCKIKSISCKLFVCPYLRFQKKIKFPIKKIPYLHYFYIIF